MIKYDEKAKCKCCGKHPYAEGRVIFGILLDASGSMGCDGKFTGAIEGLNAFVETQHKLATKVEAFVTLELFGSEGNDRTIYEPVPFSQAPLLDGDCNWRTMIQKHTVTHDGKIRLSCHSSREAMFDGVNRLIDRLTDYCSHNDKVIIVVVCDGNDCASRVSTKMLRKKIADRLAKNWEFLILGCGNDGSAVQRELGVKAGSTCADTGRALKKSLEKFSQTAASLRLNGNRLDTFEWYIGKKGANKYE